MSSRSPSFPWITRGGLISRSNHILAVLTRHGLGWLLNRLESNLTSRRKLRMPSERGTRVQAERLRMALSELGATFIKLGQALSARSDLLPQEYIEELAKLQDAVPPLPFAQMRSVLEEDLGAPLEALFCAFDPEPIASASIGQVYAAELKSGEPVVVKIVRPGVLETVEQDLEILADIADWASGHLSIGRLYDLPALVDEFAYTLRNELDYHLEGRNIDIFRRNFAGDPRVYIPRVYWDLTAGRVVTLERVGGLKISDIEGLDRAGIDRRRVAENLMHFALRQIFEFGVYHADPHPGNFFVQPDASLYVLDFGMVGRLNRRTKATLLGIAMSIQRHDSDLLVDELLAAGFYTHSIRRATLRRELEHMLDRLAEGDLRELTAGQMTGEIMNIALHHNLQLPSELVSMARAVAISEGTGMRLYPGFHLAFFANDYLEQFWKEQQSLHTLLPRVGQTALDGLELSLNLPRQASRLLGQLERGQMEFSINMEWLKEFSQQMQQMTNRLALAIILGGTIVALGLVMVVYHPQEWQALGDWVFGLGFVSSLAFGAWLMWSILRSGRGP